MLWLIAARVACFSLMALAAEPPNTPAPQATAAQPPAAPVLPPAIDGPKVLPLEDQPVGGFKSAGELLARLENAGREMRSFKADVQYTKTFAAVEGGDKQVRRGTLWYQVRADRDLPGQSRRAFAVIFDTLVVNDSQRAETRHFIFDGTHLVERDQTTRQFIKRRVVKPGQTIDPLRLGEGPFPLPIGQKQREIESRFTAVLLRPQEGFPEGAVPRLLDQTVQLMLIPKPGSPEARDFDQIRIWYRLSDFLPRMAQTTTPNGSASEILLINHQLNGPIEPAVFDVDPPKEQGWQVDIREDFRGLNEAGQNPSAGG